MMIPLWYGLFMGASTAYLGFWYGRSRNWGLFEKTKETTNEINLPKAVFEVVNICTGVGKTIKELIELTELVTNQKIPYQTFPERTGDHGIILGNNNKLRSMFHREPQKTVLEAIEDEWKFENTLS